MKHLWFVLAAASLLLGSCATMQPQATPISTGDVAALKGHWEGTRTIVIQHGENLNFAEMDILNDSIPLRGTVTLHLESGAAGIPGADIRRYPFVGAVIDPNGNLEINLPEDNRMALSFQGSDKNTLTGIFFHRGNRGTVTFRRK